MVAMKKKKDKQKENHLYLVLGVDLLMGFPMKWETDTVYEPSYRSLKSTAVTKI